MMHYVAQRVSSRQPEAEACAVSQALMAFRSDLAIVPHSQPGADRLAALVGQLLHEELRLHDTAQPGDQALLESLPHAAIVAIVANTLQQIWAWQQRLS